MNDLLTAEMAIELEGAHRRLCESFRLTYPSQSPIACALSAIATGCAQVVRFVSDRDPPIDKEVVTVDEAGHFGTWLGDKDEEPGDWKRKFGGALPAVYWLEGLRLP